MRRAAALLLVVAAGCGVRPDATPRGLDPSVVPSEIAATPVPRPATVVVHLVRDGRLVPARRVVAADPTPAHRLAALLRGPDAREQADGLRSAVHGRLTVTVRAGVAVVRGEVDDPLAAAQVVLTLTETSEVTAVRFPRPAAVPGGGSRTTVTRADYAAWTG